MTRKKAAQCIAAIKSLYSYYAKDTDPEMLVGLWTGLLAEYEDAEVSFGLSEAMRVCKVPPTPADVISQINKAREAEAPTESELWSVYLKAMRKAYGYVEDMKCTYVHEDGRSDREIARERLDRLFRDLPVELQTYIGSTAVLIEKAKQYAENDSVWEENRFRKSLPSLRERVDSAKKLERLRATLAKVGAAQERAKING